jgi:hypothetical protein
MDINELIRNIIKRPFQRGNKVLVYDGNNKLIETHSTIELGKAYFSMSNDSFFDVYGFNFVPSGTYYELSKRAAGKL